MPPLVFGLGVTTIHMQYFLTMSTRSPWPVATLSIIIQRHGQLHEVDDNDEKGLTLREGSLASDKFS